MTDDPRLTTINDAATRTGKSRATIYRLIARDGVETAELAGFTLVNMYQLRTAIANTPAKGGNRRAVD